MPNGYWYGLGAVTCRHQELELRYFIIILNVKLVPDAPYYMDGFINIPNEIVGKIFIYCLPNSKFHRPDPHLAPILLTHVCRSWRDFARQYGLL